MSTGTRERTRRLGVETTGIEIIDEAARTARPRDLFWPWFAANVSVFGISYAAFALAFGISFWQGVLVAVVGIVVSFLLCGVIAIAGKRGSAPTMVLSRAAFGVTGQKVPGVISWLTSIGWETFLAITATLATATIFRELGWGGGTGTKVVAALVTAALIVLASVAGYHVIMRMQSWLTWITGAVTILYVAMTLDHISWSTVTAIPAGSTQAVIGALVLLMTGFGLGWINIAADWSRYQHRDAKGSAIVGWNTFGGAVAPVLLVVFGLLLAGSSQDLSAGNAAAMCDPTQIHQVVMNLCANAVQAMKAGGQLVVGVRALVLDTPYAMPTSTLAPGPYVCIAVRDNGVFAPATALAAQMMEAVVNSGRGGDDCASLGALVAELSGLKD